MKVAKNEKGKYINIIASNKEDKYYCIACGCELKRIFTDMRQYYKHPIGVGDDCENKIKGLSLEIQDKEFIINETEILEKELYNKKFEGMDTLLSDYKSEEGHFLTQEQKEIIFSDNDRIKVEALAGSGKSNTLYYYCKERPNKKILYIVYNRSMREESEHTFGKLPNVTIKTVHGLAYSYYGKMYSRKLITSGNYTAYDTMVDLRLNMVNDLELGIKIHKCYNEFLLSDVKNISDIKTFDEDELKYKIIKKTEELFELKKNLNNKVVVEHDFYLKLFHLSEPNLSNLYDIICLDESQDSSALVLDLIVNSKVKGIIMVGDKFQQLYAWRKAINIMEKFDAKEYKLSTSFRVSNNISHLSNLILNHVGEFTPNMKGFNPKNMIVDQLEDNEQCAILCRTNSKIFEQAFEAVSINKKIFFEGGYNGYKFEILLDSYNFSLGQRPKNYTLQKYPSYSKMLEIAKETKDIEVILINYLIEKYSSSIPSLINSVKNNTVSQKDKADIILTTIHKSKGQTYRCAVKIANGHLDMEELFSKKYEKEEEIKVEDYYEEMCLTYVAITRGAREICLSDNLKKYFIKQHRYFNGGDE